VASEEVWEVIFRGALSEWACAPPALALVAKSWGSLRGSSSVGGFPGAGNFSHATA
jgi:hypothetical protein